jgi:proteic killer suppression protein
VIRSFRDPETEKLFNGIRCRKFQAIERMAVRKLFQLHAAKSLHDLRSPGAALEVLKGSRAGQHSIRINDKYRVCFNWRSGDAYNAEVTDYH